MNSIHELLRRPDPALSVPERVAAINAAFDRGVDLAGNVFLARGNPISRAATDHPAILRVVLERFAALGVGPDHPVLHVYDSGLGCTPDDNLEKLRLLLDYGADATASFFCGDSVLHANRPLSEIRLLDYGADATASFFCGDSVLHANRPLSEIRLLVAAGADPLAVNDQGETTIFWKKDADVIDYLVGLGVDPRQTANNGVTPLHVALSVEAINAYIRIGINQLDKTDSGQNMLHMVMARGLRQSVYIARCLELGVNVNEADNKGDTPLHVYIKRFTDRGDNLIREDWDTQVKPYVKTMIEMLAAAGADVNAPNHEGDSPIDICRDGAGRYLLFEEGFPYWSEICDILLEHEVAHPDVKAAE